MVTVLVEVLEVVVEIKMGDVSVEDVGVRDVLEGEVVLAVVFIIDTGVVCVTDSVVDRDWGAELVIVEVDKTEIIIRYELSLNFINLHIFIPKICKSCLLGLIFLGFFNYYFSGG